MRFWTRILFWLLAATVSLAPALPALAATSSTTTPAKPRLPAQAPQLSLPGAPLAGPAAAPRQAPAEVPGRQPNDGALPAPPNSSAVSVPVTGTASVSGTLYMYWYTPFPSTAPTITVQVCARAGCWSETGSGSQGSYDVSWYTGLTVAPGDLVTYTIYANYRNTWASPCAAWPGNVNPNPLYGAYQVLKPIVAWAWNDGSNRGNAGCWDEEAVVGYTPAPHGYLDGWHGVQGLNDCWTYGWTAFSRTSPEVVTSRILVDGVEMMRVPANGYRSDLGPGGNNVCPGGTCAAYFYTLYPLISHYVTHTLQMQGYSPMDNTWYNIPFLWGGTATLYCYEPSYGSYFYAPSPSSPVSGAVTVTLSSYQWDINNGPALSKVDYEVNCDPTGASTGAWYDLGAISLSTNPTTSVTSKTVNAYGAVSACGSPLRGNHLIVQNTQFASGGWSGDYWDGANWNMPWTYSTTARALTMLWDLDAPTTTAALSGTLAASGWYTTPVTVNLSAVDNPTNLANSGVAATWYKPPSGGWTKLVGSSFTLNTAGTNTYSYYSVDNAGNTEVPTTKTLQIDNVAPVSTYLLSGTQRNGWFTSTVTFQMSASDATSGVAHKWAQVDGGAWQDLGAGNGPANLIVPLASGTHSVTYYSCDVAGNCEAQRTASVPMDITPPTTTATLTGNLGLNNWYTSSVTVTLSATDGAGSGISSTVLAGTAYVGPRAYTAQGTTSVQYYSTDLAGNIETPKTATFQIDSVPPTSTYTLSGTLGLNGWYASAVTFAMTASDAASGVSDKFVRLDGGAWQDLGAGAGPGNYPVAGDGAHSLQYQARDYAG